jgi:hypothetical protein
MAGRERAGDAWTGRPGLQGHPSLPETEVSNNGKHSSFYPPPFLLFLSQFLTEYITGSKRIFLNKKSFCNNSRKNCFLIKPQIVLSYFKGNGQLKQLIKGIII